MTPNFLQVARTAFVEGLRVFKPRRGAMRSKASEWAVLDFEAGYLSIECRGKTAVMHAEGEWEGVATFREPILNALVLHPPTIDPVVISYAEDHLLIGGMTVKCYWSSPKQRRREALENPGFLDLLAIERSLPRVVAKFEYKVRNALDEKDRRIRLAAKHLREFGINEEEVEAMVKARIDERAKFLSET